MAVNANLSHAQAAVPVWTCQRCGEGLDGACGLPRASSGCRLDAELIVHRLEAAGSTLLAMRGRSPWPAQYRCALPDVLHEAVLAYGWTGAEIRPALPDSQAISRMDHVWTWLGLIPQQRFVVRRIVAARALVSPTTGKHILHWRALAGLLHMDYRAAQRWHAAGIDLIVTALRNGC